MRITKNKQTYRGEQPKTNKPIEDNKEKQTKLSRGEQRKTNKTIQTRKKKKQTKLSRRE